MKLKTPAEVNGEWRPRQTPAEQAVLQYPNQELNSILQIKVLNSLKKPVSLLISEPENLLSVTRKKICNE